MKLAYSNWHKEIVHDDAIQGELSNMTRGQLEFTNTPYVKAFRQNDNQRDYRGGGNNNGKRQQKFQQRNNNNNGGNRNNDNRNNDNRNNNGGNRNNKFNKKRFK